MTDQTETQTVGPLGVASTPTSAVPTALTWLVWALWAASLVAVVARLRGGVFDLPGPLAIDGLTVLLWVVVTFFSGVVHSYARRYLAGAAYRDRFFTRLFGFTAAVLVLAAATHLAAFVAAWLAMGLVMADLVGSVRGWPQARAAASLARRYFLASSALLGLAAGVLWWATGATTIAGVGAAAGSLSTPVWAVAAGALLLAAMVQSALVPFHTWLLSSMTAPTPASALMHAGFVNAGGILLLRFAPVVTVDPAFMLLVAVVGATSAIAGKLMKTVQADVKGRLGCSTTGQMGFMVLQAGLGFFGAAVTHLVLHGFYKAYLFLSTGGQVERTSPTAAKRRGGTDALGWVVSLLSAVAGGAVFAVLTGKGTHLDAGLLLTGLVALTTLHAARTAVAGTDLPPALRYVAVPLVALAAVAVYAVTYTAVTTLLADLPLVTAPAELTALHGVVAAAFLAVYLAVETGLYRRSDRLYVWLLNASQPAAATVLTATEEYDEY